MQAEIVVLEGIDSSGKSTVIQGLKQKYGSGYHPIFIDRWVYSNYVYNTLRGRDYTDKLMICYNRFMHNFKVEIFYLDIDPNAAYFRSLSKDDVFKYTAAELSDIKNGFETAFKVFGCTNVHRINSDRPVDCVVEDIWKVLHHM